MWFYGAQTKEAAKVQCLLEHAEVEAERHALLHKHTHTPSPASPLRRWATTPDATPILMRIVVLTSNLDISLARELSVCLSSISSPVKSINDAAKQLQENRRKAVLSCCHNRRAVPHPITAETLLKQEREAKNDETHRSEMRECYLGLRFWSFF